MLCCLIRDTCRDIRGCFCLRDSATPSASNARKALGHSPIALPPFLGPGSRSNTLQGTPICKSRAAVLWTQELHSICKAGQLMHQVHTLMRAAAIASPAMPAPAIKNMSWSANGLFCLCPGLVVKLVDDAEQYVRPCLRAGWRCKHSCAVLLANACFTLAPQPDAAGTLVRRETKGGPCAQCCDCIMTRLL